MFHSWPRKVYVVLRQPPASKLANLFRIDVRYHALGLVVTQQLGGRVTVPAVLLALCRLVENKWLLSASRLLLDAGDDRWRGRARRLSLGRSPVGRQHERGHRGGAATHMAGRAATGRP